VSSKHVLFVMDAGMAPSSWRLAMCSSMPIATAGLKLAPLPHLTGLAAVRQACCSASEQRIACWAVAKRTNTGIVVVVHALVGRSEISLELCGPKSWKRAGMSCAEKNNNFRSARLLGDLTPIRSFVALFNRERVFLCTLPTLPHSAQHERAPQPHYRTLDRR
jgi:hypothetical protein